MLSPVNTGTRSDNRERLPVFEGATEIFRAGVQPAPEFFPNLITPLDATFPSSCSGRWPSTAPGWTSSGSRRTGATARSRRAPGDL
jgi:hypothetical protein